MRYATQFCFVDLALRSSTLLSDPLVVAVPSFPLCQCVQLRARVGIAPRCAEHVLLRTPLYPLSNGALRCDAVCCAELTFDSFAFRVAPVFFLCCFSSTCDMMRSVLCPGLRGTAFGRAPARSVTLPRAAIRCDTWRFHTLP